MRPSPCGYCGARNHPLSIISGDPSGRCVGETANCGEYRDPWPMGPLATTGTTIPKRLYAVRL